MVLFFEHCGQYDRSVRWKKGRSPGCDRDLAASDDAIPGAHERVMRQRVKPIVRNSCGITERSASSAARSYFKSRTEYEQNQIESRRILVCQKSSIKCAEGVRIKEAGQQVAKSLTPMHEY